MKLLKTETTVLNGVRVVKRTYPEGTTVEAECQCFGLPNRVHSTSDCPNLTPPALKGARDNGRQA